MIGMNRAQREMKFRQEEEEEVWWRGGGGGLAEEGRGGGGRGEMKRKNLKLMRAS
jgi:hypothetical protein